MTKNMEYVLKPFERGDFAIHKESKTIYIVKDILKQYISQEEKAGDLKFYGYESLGYFNAHNFTPTELPDYFLYTDDDKRKISINSFLAKVYGYFFLDESGMREYSLEADGIEIIKEKKEKIMTQTKEQSVMPTPRNTKPGDKVKLKQPYQGLVEGQIYVVERWLSNDSNETLLFVEDTGVFARRFEKVEDKEITPFSYGDTVKCIKTLSLPDVVFSMGRQYYVASLTAPFFNLHSDSFELVNTNIESFANKTVADIRRSGGKVRVTHRRYYSLFNFNTFKMEEGLLTKREVEKLIGECGHIEKLHPNGGETTIEITKQGREYKGVAKCCKEDAFNRKTGLQTALANLK